MKTYQKSREQSRFCDFKPNLSLLNLPFLDNSGNLPEKISRS